MYRLPPMTRDRFDFSYDLFDFEIFHRQLFVEFVDLGIFGFVLGLDGDEFVSEPRILLFQRLDASYDTVDFPGKLFDDGDVLHPVSFVMGFVDIIIE